MRRLQGWMCRLGGLFSQRRHEREFEAELSSHLQFHIDENLRANMTPDAARREALIRLGGVESTKERWRDRRSVPLFDHILQDARYSVRTLRKNPGFAATPRQACRDHPCPDWGTAGIARSGETGGRPFRCGSCGANPPRDTFTYCGTPIVTSAPKLMSAIGQ